MKQTMIRTASVVLLLATLLSILPIYGSPQSTLVYSTTSNSGLRDQLCTTLDGTGAENYYGNDYSYDLLSELSTDQLYDALEELMTDTHKKITTYSECRDLAVKTDCEQGDGRIILLYTSYSANGMADYTNNRTGGWNREHVWPQSLGGNNTNGGGADLHHIRPSDGTVNSKRGNKLYGYANGGSAVYGTAVTENALGGHSSTYFEPLDNVKGDVARICLYMYVRWNSGWGCDSITEVFESIDVLLDWCEQDPVDTWEMGRNEVVGAIQGNRNVFIDYPEYAWLLFGREVPDDMITPSGEASEGNEGGTTTCTHPSTQLKYTVAATCGKDGYSGATICKECGKKIKSGNTIPATGNHSFGAWTTNADGSKSRTCSGCQKVETEGVVLPGTSATISFTDVANRTVYSSTQQVWKQNGITITNDKASSASNVGDYTNPGRFYKGSKVTITAPGMTKIVIDCTGLDNKYVTPWSNSFTDSNATASVSGKIVTITFKNPVDSFTWSAMSAQGRAYKMTVTTASEGGVTPPETTPDNPPATTPDTPAVIPSTLAEQIAQANKLANKTYLSYESTITGTITDTPKPSDYNAGQFKFTVSDGTNTLLCYYTPVTGGTPAIGDTITVTGKLTAYNGDAQFDSTASAVLKKDSGDAPCTHSKTELRGVKAATCKDAGYTGDTYCTACDEKIATGKTISATGNHTFGQWSTNDDGSKSRTCSVCGKVETEAAPPATDPVTPPVTEPVTPPVTEPVTPPATEPVTPPVTEPVTPPVTEPVTPPATEPTDCPHANVENRNEVAPTCKEGYSGDLYCKDCGALVEKGIVYPPVSAHEYGEAVLSADGTSEKKVCKVCNDELITPITSGSTSELLFLWIVIGSICVIAAIEVVIIVMKKKRRS